MINKKLIIPENAVVVYDNDANTIYGGNSNSILQGLEIVGISSGIVISIGLCVMLGGFAVRSCWNYMRKSIKRRNMRRKYSIGCFTHLDISDLP